MEHFNVVMSLIGMQFLALLGVYAWMYKVSRETNQQLAEIYKLVNQHLQQANIHTPRSDTVSSDVCTTLHRALKEDIDEIKGDVKELLKQGNGKR